MNRFGPLSRPLFAAMMIFTIWACGGGGCSGCAGCGIAPIPGGFPIAERIPNSAQVRLSESGIQFIEENIAGIVATLLPDGLDFPIPATSTTFSGIDVNVCPSGDCSAHIEIQDLDLVPTAPNRLHATVRLLIDSRVTGGGHRSLPINFHSGPCAFGVCFIDTTCQADIESRNGDRDFVAFQADIAFATETEPARAGYTRIDITDAMLVDGQGIEDADVTFGSCSGAVGFILNLVSGFLVDTLIGQLEDQVNGLVGDAIGDQLCTTQGEFGCPTGTFADGTGPDAVCRFAADSSSRCVPTLLGIDGRGDLGGQFLGGFSPGTHAPIQLVLASGDDGEAVNNGLSLFMHGGFMSMDRAFASSPGHNPCVPLREAPPLPDVARAEGFRGNVIPGTSVATHIGIGIAEDYLDYAGYGMFDSGMLCIGAGTRLSQQLSTGLVSGVAPSLRQLAFPQEAAALTMAIRPQQPPDFTIGTDAGAPLIQIAMPEVMIDFYVWSTERYVRFMTYQTDLTIDINLTVSGGEIVPMIAGVVATNSMVFNNEMITDNPDGVARALESVISSFAGMLAGSISPIALPDIMGFELDVPPEGIRGINDSGENFLGIFANLRLATTPLVAEIDTTLELGDLTLDRDSMTLETWGQGPGTSAWLHFGANGQPGADYEYSYRIDGMTWSPWTTDPRVQVNSEVLLLQARHVVEARARIVGEAGTVDQTPARAELLVDLEAPVVALSRDGTGYVVTAADIISPDSALQYRFRVPGGEWTEWQSNARFEPETLLLDGGTLGVEVLDESGNTGSASIAIIRGIANPAGGGCGCGVLDGNPSGNEGLAFLGSLLVLGTLLARRRHKVGPGSQWLLALLVASPAFLGAAGCECGTPVDPTGPCNDECLAAVLPVLDGTMCCEMTDECSPYNLDALCEPGFTCPVDNVTIGDTCDISCSECMRKPPLQPGLLATDLDLVVTEGGETYVSGYSPGVPPRDMYGDLVFGEVQADGSVDWEIVDGAPSSPIVADPDGWRGGVEAPGADVGRWTTMVDSGTSLYIAYYDATEGALKMAIGSPGAWEIHTIDDAGDSGRYASMVLVGGIPSIAYLRIEPGTGGVGPLRSSVRVATAASAAPAGATDWSIAEVAGAEMACRPQFCGGGLGMHCLESGACAMQTSDCPAACASGEACVAGSCQATLPDGYVEDLPPAYGLYTSLVSTSGGLALVWYDRSQGNIWGASQSGAAWNAPFVIDGYVRADPNTGDSGIGASLFVDAAGTWHVSYVDGAEEALRYAQVTGGTVTLRETIDDGATDGMTAHTDGRHVVGDDSSIVVTDGGEVRVAYQDSTNQHVMLARRASGGTWTVSVLDDVNHTGFWVEQLLVGSTSYVGTWWRQQERTGSTNGVRVLTAE